MTKISGGQDTHYISVCTKSEAFIQSTPVISRLLGAKIRERELSGSPIISRCRAKATTREFRITDPHSLAFTTLKQYVER